MEAAQKENLYIPPKTVCRTIHQYSKEAISGEDMGKLQEIAQDYRSVKNYVYARYGGIGSLPKLYPGYTVQNEMTDSGLRTELTMPSVYFYRAVFDALGDIKGQWVRTKQKLVKLIGQNENFVEEEKHYLRFLLKSVNAFAAVLNQSPIELPHDIKQKYDELAGQVDTEKLHKYLCRQVRKYHIRNLHTDVADGFFITERAYRYGQNKVKRSSGLYEEKYGIFIATKENRKRVFIPLTDKNAYKKQLYIKLKPEESRIEIAIPIETKVRIHKDYRNEIGLSIGIFCMFTTNSGHVYGEGFGELHKELVEYISAAERTYRKEKENNAGRKKYKAHKAKLDAKMETYVNQEINRMIATEKPQIIYLPKLPKNSAAGYNKEINYSVNVWKKGLIRERLEQKCRVHSIEIVEVIGRAISTQCSRCGAVGKYSKDIFKCGSCNYEADKKVNAAKNAIKRGKSSGNNNSPYLSKEEAKQE